MKISIGIPFYNASEFLEDAINSILNQSFKDWELILIDDGSTDESLSIALKFEKKDDRIRVISDGLNKKLPFRLNQIIDEAKYPYIARMDADDLVHPDRLKIQLKFLEENPHYDLVSSSMISIDNYSIIKGVRVFNFNYNDFNTIKRHYPIVHASLLVRKEWYLRNKYDPSLPRSEDFELWCRAISKNDFKISVISDILYYYREEGMLTLDKMKKSYLYGLDIYKKYCKKPSAKVIFSINLKILTLYALSCLGLLQLLTKLRNDKLTDNDLLIYHTSIIKNTISMRNNCDD
jgi:glycosyltransferase involved in cell wall biosynthesis